jgi:hypothetical protein
MTKISAPPAYLHGVDKDYTYLCCSHVYVSGLKTAYKDNNYFFAYLRHMAPNIDTVKGFKGSALDIYL